MFGKTKILRRLEAVEIENAKLYFMINNPPRLKVGQRIGDTIIRSVEAVPIYAPFYFPGSTGVTSRNLIIGWKWEYKSENSLLKIKTSKV